LDPKIKKLVLALNQAGIQTSHSCQGHDDWQKHHFPWIIFNWKKFFDNPEEEKIKKIVEEYNNQKTSEEEWWEVVFNENGKTYWLKPKHEYKSLEWLQEQAEKLADYINYNSPK